MKLKITLLALVFTSFFYGQVITVFSGNGLNTPFSLDFVGNDLYISDFGGAVYKINVNSATPSLNQVLTTTSPRAMTISGNRLYIYEAPSRVGFYLLDDINNYITSVAYNTNSVSSILLNNNLLYFSEPDLGRISKVDVSTTPYIKTPILNPTRPRDMFLVNNTVYVAEGDTEKISSFNITDANPVLVDFITNLGAAPQAIAVLNGYMYVGLNSGTGLVRYDMSVANPVAEEITSLPGIRDFEVRGNEIYIAHDNTISKIDTSNLVTGRTAIQDTAFENALFNLGIDSDNVNGGIYNSDAAEVTALTVSSNNIGDLSGIEAFVNLETLNVGMNNLSSINLSTLTELRVLQANSNNLTSVDFSNNPDMTTIVLEGNRITSFNGAGLPNLQSIQIGDQQAGFLLNSLNVSTNTDLSIITAQRNNLSSLNIANNPLTTLSVFGNNISGDLDLSTKPNLGQIDLSDNSFSAINIANGNNTSLGNAFFQTNPNLTCIQVDDVVFANNNWTKDATANYSTNCAALSTYDQKLQVAVNIYPNPTFNTVNIETPQTIKSLKLTNINGQVIFETKTALNKMDLTAYNAGIYFISIETDKGVSTKKIVKQ